LLLEDFGFLLGLLLDPEDGGDMFLRNIWLSPNYMALRRRGSSAYLLLVYLTTLLIAWIVQR
jgi:hypothetical protein